MVVYHTVSILMVCDVFLEKRRRTVVPLFSFVFFLPAGEVSGVVKNDVRKFLDIDAKDITILEHENWPYFAQFSQVGTICVSHCISSYRTQQINYLNATAAAALLHLDEFYYVFRQFQIFALADEKHDIARANSISIHSPESCAIFVTIGAVHHVTTLNSKI